MEKLPEVVIGGYAHKVLASLGSYPLQYLATQRQVTTKSNWELIREALQCPRRCMRGVRVELLKVGITPAITFPLLTYGPDQLRELGLSSLLANATTGAAIAVTQGIVTKPLQERVIQLQAGQSPLYRGIWKGAGLNTLRLLPPWLGFSTIGLAALERFDNPVIAAVVTAGVNTAASAPFDYAFNRYATGLSLSKTFWRGAGWRALARSKEAMLALLILDQIKRLRSEDL